MRACILFIALCGFVHTATAQTLLRCSPAPVDNPLKGLVPYAGTHAGKFPHSMEFNYLPLSDLMIGENKFRWQPLEDLLNDIASRRHQTVFRIWMEYPGRTDGIPRYLENNGLKVTEWLNTATEPFPSAKVRTPDYSDQRLRKALQDFIAALGQRYDGDPRIGFITAGLLGVWGEWHNYPRTELMASKEVQTEVMDAFERHFKKTPVLLRYPAGSDNYHYAENHKRRLGYHDDSFAFATLDTGRDQDNWFFVPAMKAAGPLALNKWKSSPIGGEIRPELWGRIFDNQPPAKGAQNFAECIRQTHATWLMDTGMFSKQQSEERVLNAKKQVRRMGYEFHVESFDAKSIDDAYQVTVKIRNTGVAPFYYDWKVELGAFSAEGSRQQTFSTTWTVRHIMPNSEGRELQMAVPLAAWPTKAERIAIRVANAMSNGMPLRFANEASMQLEHGWLLLGRIKASRR